MTLESRAYAEALRFREKALDRRLTFVEGVAPCAIKLTPGAGYFEDLSQREDLPTFGVDQ